MSMFCYQCQEAAGNEGCTVRGVCGKTEDVANLQDLLIFVLKGISYYAQKAKEYGVNVDQQTGPFIMKNLFSTITNGNFDAARFEENIQEALEMRESVKNEFMKAYKNETGQEFDEEIPEAATWSSDNVEDFYKKGEEVGVLSTKNEDIRSLRELITYGVKGIAAYADHAYILNESDLELFDFMQKALKATLDDSKSVEDYINLVMETGDYAVKTMALLDKANTENYGHPEPTEVNVGVNDNPAILISGHDLKDMEELLKQTEGTGVDVYTHGEMLPANSYPAFKKYDHFVGNYGNSWWLQKEEFEKFNGPVLLTTNCLVPPKDSYKDRVYTTGVVGFDGVTHIEGRPEGGQKDFSEIIDHAKQCDSPTELETGTIPGGFAHEAVMNVADKVIEAVENGDIERFVVMAGCDGRHNTREYYTDVAKELPEEAVILTAGCAKFRYNKLDLGDIGGIPRILDAGQCNDSYSLVYIAQQLQEAMGVDDINDLPISYDIAWYEQKAVTVLLALLSLGIKGIRLGPTLPAFLSENVVKVLVENFDIKPIGEVKEDVEKIMAGK
ncbi:MAG TPA: hydroxylamine reductase [Halanaerobiales bacterium]|nr:hydroxylamine reductase [Halanaerobiales bacterium]